MQRERKKEIFFNKERKCRNKYSESEYKVKKKCFESENEKQRETLLIKVQRGGTNIYAKFLVSLT
jgi:hypothetical protein